MEQSGERIQVLIIDDVAETRENLRKLLSFEPDIEVVGAAGSGMEGIELAKEYRPHIVLMDINMPGMDGITATEKILEEVPSTQVVMLSVQGETDYLRRAMLAGARDFLTKPASGDELMSTLHRVYEMGKTRRPSRPAPAEPGVSEPAPPQGEREGRDGEIVAVFSPKGGTGCTTVAVNLVIALRQSVDRSRKVALMDADFQFGDVGVMLDLQASRSIADLIPRVDEVDSDMLNSVLLSHGAGIEVLLAPPTPEAAERLMLLSAGTDDGTGQGRPLEKIMDLMRANFDVVVVDMWSWIDDLALTVFDNATLIVLVVTPDIPAIKNARLFLEVAEKLDYPMEGIALVINSVDRHRGIKVEKIEDAMMPVAAQIPYDERAALTAANRGVPFLVRDRSRSISQGILQLSRVVHEKVLSSDEVEEDDEERQEEPSGLGGTGLLRLKQVFDRD